MPDEGIGTKVSVLGDKEYKAALADIGRQLTVLNTSMVASQSAFDGQGDAMDALKAKSASLQSIDQLMEMEILLTIKYEMVLQGFNAAKQAAPQPEKPPAEEPTGKKAHRGGRKRLTMDDIDRIFEIFFTMTAEEKDLIRGLLDSDKERRAAVPR